MSNWTEEDATMLQRLLAEAEAYEAEYGAPVAHWFPRAGIVYGRVLTEKEIELVERYLAEKYGVKL